jgi:hypothetical protein
VTIIERDNWKGWSTLFLNRDTWNVRDQGKLVRTIIKFVSMNHRGCGSDLKELGDILFIYQEMGVRVP